MLINTTTSTKLDHYLKDTLTGIYISLVLFVFLVIFVSYFLCIFCKKKRDLRRREIMKNIINTTSENSDNLVCNEVGLLNGANNEVNAEMSRKNSEFIDYLIAKQEDSLSISDISRKNSLVRPVSKNQLLNSKVSLILLSSAISQTDNLAANDISKRVSIEKIDQDTVELLKKFLNSPKLDKPTANMISDKILQYYENTRKQDSLSSLHRCSIPRSRSISSLNNDTIRKHRLRSSFKNNPSTVNIGLKYDDQFKRKWASEKHTLSNKRSNYKISSRQDRTAWEQAEEKKTEKKNKPTTIYELYRSNKMQISNLFTNYDDEK